MTSIAVEAGWNTTMRGRPNENIRQGTTIELMASVASIKYYKNR